MENIKISVVIATYNRSKVLGRVLESLLVQEGLVPESFEVIVVNNNSSDDTATVIQSYVDKFNGRLRYLFEEKQGKSYALNRGIDTAKGEIIAFTDDDCVADRRWAAQIQEVFAMHDIDLLAGKVLAVMDGQIPPWLDIETLHGPLAHYDKGNVYFESTEKAPLLVTGANMVARKSSITQYGSYGYAGRAQDTELTSRWRKLGAKIAYSPNVVVKHHNDPARLTKRYFKRWYFATGVNYTEIFASKFYKGRCFLRIPLWVYREISKCGFNYLKNLVMIRHEAFHHLVFLYYHLGIVYGTYTTRAPQFRKLR